MDRHRYVVEVLEQTGPDDLITRGYVGPDGLLVRSMHEAQVRDYHDAASLVESIRLVCPQVLLRARPRPVIHTPMLIAAS